ncbi:MAG: substrate-binding domain-containing protein [Suipraeoptans sp.]
MKRTTIEKMGKRVLSFCLITIFLIFTITGCNDDETRSENSQDSTENVQDEKSEEETRLSMILPFAYSSVEDINLEKGSSISIIGQKSSGAYWTALKNGANKAVEDINKILGYEGQDKVKVVYSSPSNSDIEQQINILDEELARYPVALAISPLDMKACEVQFDLASENNIPIVTFNSGSDYPGVNAYVGTDNINSSNEVAERIQSDAEENEKVLVVSASSKCKAESTRETAFLEAITKGEKPLEAVETFKIDDTETTLTKILSADKDIKGIYATSAEATDAVTEELSKSMYKYRGITFIGYDITEASKKALTDKVADAVIEQNPYGMGYATVIAAARAALDMGNEAVVDTGYKLITADKLDDETLY